MTKVVHWAAKKLSNEAPRHTACALEVPPLCSLVASLKKTFGDRDGGSLPVDVNARMIYAMSVRYYPPEPESPCAGRHTAVPLNVTDVLMPAKLLASEQKKLLYNRFLH